LIDARQFKVKRSGNMLVFDSRNGHLVRLSEFKYELDMLNLHIWQKTDSKIHLFRFGTSLQRFLLTASLERVTVQELPCPLLTNVLSVGSAAHASEVHIYALTAGLHLFTYLLAPQLSLISTISLSLPMHFIFYCAIIARNRLIFINSNAILIFSLPAVTLLWQITSLPWPSLSSNIPSVWSIGRDIAAVRINSASTAIIDMRDEEKGFNMFEVPYSQVSFAGYNQASGASAKTLDEFDLPYDGLLLDMQESMQCEVEVTAHSPLCPSASLSLIVRRTSEIGLELAAVTVVLAGLLLVYAVKRRCYQHADNAHDLELVSLQAAP
jgi:hypothetical protein